MKKNKKGITLFLVMMAFICGCLVTYYIYNNSEQKIKENRKSITTTTLEETSDFKSAIGEVYDSVVYVETKLHNRIISSGSGFVYKKDDKNAYILTNYHVIEEGDSFSITLANDIDLEATYVNGDQYYDMAVLKVESKEVSKVAKLGDSSSVELGDSVFAVGSPLGKEYMGTITKGIVSGVNRMLSVKLSNGTYLMEVIQTDAPINSGNSGGPLCNIKGEVIGISSSKMQGTGVEGLGFAIPIDLIKAILDDIEQGKTIERPYLGIKLVDITNKELFEYQYKIKISDKAKDGVILGYVQEGEIADKVGLKVGDVIIEIDNKKVKDTSHFIYELFKHKKGDKITIKYYRDNEIKEVTLTLTDTIRND